jgi:hypothetical protein
MRYLRLPKVYLTENFGNFWCAETSPKGPEVRGKVYLIRVSTTVFLRDHKVGIVLDRAV